MSGSRGPHHPANEPGNFTRDLHWGVPKGKESQTHRPKKHWGDPGLSAPGQGSLPPGGAQGGAYTSIRAESAHSTCQAHRRGWPRLRLWPPICIHSLSMRYPHPVPGRHRFLVWTATKAPFGFLVTSQEP